MVDLKDLKIKTGVAKRLLKELASYKKEVEKDEARVTSMRESGADPHDLKQQEAVLAESRMMVPDCQKRLENAFYDLESLVEASKGDPSVSESEEAKAAAEVLENAREVVEG